MNLPWVTIGILHHHLAASKKIFINIKLVYQQINAILLEVYLTQKVRMIINYYSNYYRLKTTNIIQYLLLNNISCR